MSFIKRWKTGRPRKSVVRLFRTNEKKAVINGEYDD